MIVENESFFVVQTPDDDHVVASEDDAIAKLKNGAEIDPDTEDVTVAEVSFTDDDWTIKELPWQRIALQLLQD